MASQIALTDSPPVYGGYIGSLYILAGAVMFFDSLADVVPSGEGMILILVMTFLLALIGLIMSSLHRTRGTKNRSKLIAVFACIMTGCLFYGFWVLIFFSGSMSEVLDRIMMISRYVLPLVSGIIIITMTCIDNPAAPHVSFLAKLIVGISAIISAGFRGFLYLSKVQHLNFIGIILSVVIVCGTILGLVLGIMAEDKRSISVDPSRLRESVEVHQPLIIH
jgi:hypothetical protein